MRRPQRRPPGADGGLDAGASGHHACQSGGAPLPAHEQALVRLALKVVRDANGVTGADLDGPRGLGWSDGDIFDALNHGTRQAAADALLNALHVEWEF